MTELSAGLHVVRLTLILPDYDRNVVTFEQFQDLLSRFFDLDHGVTVR